MAKNNWLNCQRQNERLHGALKRLDRQIEWPAKFTAGFVASSGSLLIGFGVAMTGPMGLVAMVLGVVIAILAIPLYSMILTQQMRRYAKKLTRLTGGSLFYD